MPHFPVLLALFILALLPDSALADEAEGSCNLEARAALVNLADPSLKLPGATKFCETKSAESYCDPGFPSSKYIDADKHVEAAKSRCVDFYKAAINARDLFCDYMRKSIALNTPAQTADADDTYYDTVGRKASCARSLYHDTKAKIPALKANLANAYKKAEDINKILKDKGADHLEKEVHCQGKGVEDGVPGGQLLRMSSYAVEGQKATLDNLVPMLDRFNRDLHSSEATITAYLTRIRSLSRGAESIKPAGGIGQAPEQESGAKEAATRLGGILAMDAVQTAPGIVTRHLLSASGVLAGNSALFFTATGGVIVGLGLGYIHDGKFTKFNVSYAFATSGGYWFAWAVTNSVKAGLGSMTVVALLMQLMKNRHETQRAVVYKHYFDFHKEEKTGDDKSSAEMAKLFAEEKEKLAYCASCNARELSHVGRACPAHQWGIMDLNDDTTTDPKTQVQAPGASVCESFANEWVLHACRIAEQRRVAAGLAPGDPRIKIQSYYRASTSPVEKFKP